MVEIKKLPPGEAFGARDLQNWAHRRMRGKAGVFDKKALHKQRKRAAVLSERAGRKVKVFCAKENKHDEADRFIAEATKRKTKPAARSRPK
jgi:hypothetical protein